MLFALVRSLRPAQWVKNAFVLAPLVFAHRLDDRALLVDAALAFLAFCAASSAVYLANDVVDRERDRLHPVKRSRPIAAGELPAGAALAAAAALAALAAAGAARLGAAFSICLAGYLALNLLYTLATKHIVILDVMSIAAGFVLRVLAGAAAIDVAVSRWLLLCTTFVALFLAFAKRRHELLLMADEASTQRRVLSQYSPVFLDQMINVTTASTVLCYALYTTAPETAARLGTPHLVATVPFVLYGIFRFLYLLYQKTGARNPTEAILADPPFLLNVALWGALVVVLVYGR
jgi:4-hydroxybenzoate polyprenyltransferase